MSPNNPYDRGPLYSHGWDEREDVYRQQQPDYETGWDTAHNDYNMENTKRGGFSGSPGSNYAAGRFGGAGQGLGFDEDKYRGYYGSPHSGRDFASFYTHAYGRDDYRRPEHRDTYGDYRAEQEYYSTGQGWNPQDRDYRVSTRPEDSERRWGQEGPHRGKGPKNYQRADSRIREDVSDRLSDDPYIDASDVEVSVDHGNVVLSGRVQDRKAKRRAADLAETVSGVTNVENRLRTGQGIMENFSHAVTAAIGDMTVGPEVSRVDEPARVEEPLKKGRKRKG